jgi:hypothetical protein
LIIYEIYNIILKYYFFKFVLSELDEVQNMGTAPTYVPKSMSIYEQKRLHALIQKYGDDIGVNKYI